MKRIDDIPTQLLQTTAATALVVAGCLPAPGADNAFYVLLPYAVALVASIASLMARLGLTFRRDNPDKPASSTPAERAARWALIGAVAAALATVGMALHMLLADPLGFGYTAAAPQPGGATLLPRAYQTAWCLLMLLASGSLRIVYGRS